MDNDCAATVPTTVVGNTVDDRIARGVFATVWSTTLGGNVPRASDETEFSANSSLWSVVIGKLDMLIELVPLTLPAPQGSAVNAAPSSGYRHW